MGLVGHKLVDDLTGNVDLGRAEKLCQMEKVSAIGAVSAENALAGGGVDLGDAMIGLNDDLIAVFLRRVDDPFDRAAHVSEFAGDMLCSHSIVSCFVTHSKYNTSGSKVKSFREIFVLPTFCRDNCRDTLFSG